jgi:hypothetical protein
MHVRVRAAFGVELDDQSYLGDTRRKGEIRTYIELVRTVLRIQNLEQNSPFLLHVRDFFVCGFSLRRDRTDAHAGSDLGKPWAL